MKEEFFYEIWPARNVGELEVLTYSSDDSGLSRGDIVEVPFGRSRIVGVISARVQRPKFACKLISRKLDFPTLPAETVALSQWISGFYNTKIGVVWQNFLPAGILKNRKFTEEKPEQKMCSISRKPTEFREKRKLTNEQKNALTELREMDGGTAILRGITGSGKTEIYKQLAADAVAAGRSAIILVPEISLTTQLVDDFREFFADGISRDFTENENNLNEKQKNNAKNETDQDQIFAKILSTKSAQKETERAKIWTDALTAKRPVVAIGPRSALFLPLKNVGLIVIDEEHEPSYIQDKAPRYNAKTVAAKLTELHTNFAKNQAGISRKIKLILGSATPLVADIYGAKLRERPIVEMKNLAKKEATAAKITVVDMRQHENFTSESRIFSRELLAEMKSALADGKQVLLFHNRRGSAATTMCENCGWTATCPNCYLPLTLHADKFEMRCHLCNIREKVPLKCPECGSTEILHKGIGTKKIEDECRKIFREILAKDEKAIRRFDGDTTSAETVAKVYDELKSGRTRIIIGTQQIAKGLDLPLLKVVGVVQADTGLNLPDYGARERTFELITQAIGRVGRHAAETSAVIQTYQPDEPAVNFAKTQNFWGFYDAEIAERARAHFPPFSHLLKITVSYKTEAAAVKNSRKIADEIREKYANPTDFREFISQKSSKQKTDVDEQHGVAETSVFLLGPAPAFYERIRENYRWQIIVRGNSRKTLSEIANEISRKFPATHATVELDATSLI